MKRTGGSRKADEGRFIGCCGAYCKTCRSFVLGSCKGCKLGYDEGKRSMARARCRIKVCCFGEKKQETCAECSGYGDCDILAAFHGKKWPEYRKYKESLEFIRAHGCQEFCRRAKDWRRADGEL
jgi:hypothetical protein